MVVKKVPRSFTILVLLAFVSCPTYFNSSLASSNRPISGSHANVEEVSKKMLVRVVISFESVVRVKCFFV